MRFSQLFYLKLNIKSILIFPDHQHKKIIIQRQVAVFVNETVRTAFLCYIQMGKIIEIEAFVYKFILVNINFSLLRN